jgi:plastocyanin
MLALSPKPYARQLAVVLVTLASLSACGGDSGGGIAPEVVARVDVSSPTATLAPQQSVQFAAVARTSSGAAIGSIAPVWSSSANAVATVNASGLVTGVAPGNAILRATAGGVSGTVPITVTSGSGVLASLTVNAQDRTIELGGVTQATVTGLDGQGKPLALGNRAVTWATSNASIARISSSGVATGVGVGLVDLQVTVQDGAQPRTASVPLIVQGIAGSPLTARVDMAPQSFIPFETAIRQNGTVSFVFPTLAHNVIWDRRLSGAPADINTTNEATVTRTFPTVGVFDYVCTLHPGMEGRVIVSP